MKIFTAQQVRDWDAYTIDHEPVSSLELMERAAMACFNWLTANFTASRIYTVFCGTGNNGGDGLAIARLLLRAGHTVGIYILEGAKRTADFTTNLERLPSQPGLVRFIRERDIPAIPPGAVAIDALFGSGLSRPLEGLAADLIDHINDTGKTIVSIDLPSGLFADKPSMGNHIVRATHTLAFQAPKLAFLMAGNNKFMGTVHLLDIGLNNDFYSDESTALFTIGEPEIRSVYKRRDQFSHKYDFGHALLYAGSKDMMGAAILCAKACLRSGAGLLTVVTEDLTQGIMQTAFPEAITTTSDNYAELWKKKSAIGVGPGISPSEEQARLLKKIIVEYTGPLVIDATALQLLAHDPAMLESRVGKTVLTPHSGEFERIFGKCRDDFERTSTALERASALNCHIVLKGHHTLVACPDGTGFFNTTGNAGMATAGSGDVLTGMLTGLLAQGYSSREACMLAVYLHGVAGDIAARENSQEAMIASDIIAALGAAFRQIDQATASGLS